MVKKKKFNYFEALINLATYTKEAADLLKLVIQSYDIQTVQSQAEQIHSLEKLGDQIVSEIMDELNHSFITPIEREDIVLITELIDDVLDGINLIPYLLENFNVQSIRENTDEMLTCIVKSVEGMRVVATEFSKFRNSKSLNNMIEKVNQLEAQGDALHSGLIKELFSNEKDPIEVIKWKEIFNKLEEILDKTEKTVDTLAGIVIKNS